MDYIQPTRSEWMRSVLIHSGGEKSDSDENYIHEIDYIDEGWNDENYIITSMKYMMKYIMNYMMK